ncbi:MAG TPA: helix-turn-helix domain-containing protein [Acidimicrobiia bacterium]
MTPTSQAAAPTAPSGPLPRAERRDAILRGAAEAFARAGYAATSMEDIAVASGITKLIVYRHFDSKEELYRAVLQRVFDRQAEEFVTGYGGGPGVGARSLLTVARENPAGFRLLWQHAAREPQFAEYARELREHAVDASRALLGGRVPPENSEWAAHTIVGYLVEAVLNWLEYGAAERDDEFVDLATDALRSGIGAWMSVDRP